MYKLETKNVFWYYMKYDIDSMNQSMYKFQEKKFKVLSTDTSWNYYKI